MRTFISLTVCAAATCILTLARGAETQAAPAWRTLPLIADGKVAEGWRQVGWGGFAVDDGALRTECDPKGLGLLVYKKEKFGNCQLRVVFKSKDAKSNAGVFVRIADGILEQVDLGQLHNLRGCRFMWQDPGFLYRYKIEGSVNDTDWITLVDRTDNTRAEWIPDHHFTASQVRYVRLTATQLEDGCWMGLREFEVFDAP